MDDARTYLDPRTLAKIGSLRLRARHIVEGYVAGLHRSPYRGFSIEFAEHRKYAPGDDPRYLDWKVYARSDRYYLKQFEDETNLVCLLAVDASESMAYRGPGAPLSKWEYAQCLAAALAWLVLRQQDAVGLAAFDRRVRTLVRPSAQASHLRPLIETLEGLAPGEPTALRPALHELAQRLRKRSVVILISDLLDDPEQLAAGLKRFGRRRHDLVLIHLLDPAEAEFPFEELTRFRGMEQWPDVEADPRPLRAAYLDQLARFTRAVQATCRSLSCDYHRARTDQPVDAVLSALLAARAARAG